MATLIPALGACVSRMTSGERRLGERLEQKHDDSLLWHDVPVGPKQLHPDFIVLHPSRGGLILEVKDIRLSTVVRAAKDEWTILDNASGEPKHIQSPFAQARNYTYAVLSALHAEKRLEHPAAAMAKDVRRGAPAWRCSHHAQAVYDITACSMLAKRREQ